MACKDQFSTPETNSDPTPVFHGQAEKEHMRKLLGTLAK